MKIAVLYICTGRYTIFWKDFFPSAERYFLPGHEKEYFVFTDGEIDHRDHPRVKVVHQENLGWPHMAVKRYHLFTRIKEQLRAYDLAYFCNANLLFVDVVDDAILPERDEVVVTQHPGFFDKPAREFTYERDPRSTAYVPEGEGRHYIGSGFNGARVSRYLEIIDTIRDRTDRDLAHDLIAVWHDESHLNRYIIDHPCKLISPSYLYPEGWKIPFPPKILVRDKSLLGGHDYLRGLSNERRGSALRTFRRKLEGALRRLLG